MPPKGTVPVLWPRGSVALLASGPTLDARTTAQIEAARQNDRVHVICINDAYCLAPFADVLYACDKAWWDVHYQRVRDLPMLKWSQDKRVADAYAGVKYVRGEAREGFSTDSSYIHCGKHSGFQALNLAFLLGARRIALFGYDMNRVPRGTANHFFGRHPSP
jgi:hypothetical protein